METIAQADLSATPAIVYKDFPVITTETLAGFYKAESKDLYGILNRHHQSFVRGKHYFRVDGDELYDLKKTPEYQASGSDPQVFSLILWTKLGAARLAKMLHFDEAWDAFEELEDSYFKTISKQPDTLADIAFKASHFDIKQAVQRLVLTTGDSTTWIYYRLKATFGVNSYKDIPLEQCPAAVEYLKKIEDAHFDKLKKSKVNNLEILASDTVNKVMDHYNALYAEIKRLGGVSPVYPKFDEETIVRASVTRMIDKSRMLLTLDRMTGKPRVSFIPNTSWVLHSDNIVDVIRDSSGVDRKLLPDIISAAADRLGCR